MIIKQFKLSAETDQTIKIMNGSQVLSACDQGNYRCLFMLEPEGGLIVSRPVILRREGAIIHKDYTYAGAVDFYGRMPEDDGHYLVFVGEEY